MKTINLELSIDQTNLVLEALGALPFARVYALVGHIQTQAQDQLQAQREPPAQPETSMSPGRLAVRPERAAPSPELSAPAADPSARSVDLSARPQVPARAVRAKTERRGEWADAPVEAAL